MDQQSKLECEALRNEMARWLDGEQRAALYPEAHAAAQPKAHREACEAYEKVLAETGRRERAQDAYRDKFRMTFVEVYSAKEKERRERRLI